jgi:carbonic anhydrase
MSNQFETNLFVAKQLGRKKAAFRAALLLTAALSVFALCACTSASARRTETAQHSSAEEKHWSYTGDTGPAYWHTLAPAYAIAKDGRTQSPIDIATSERTVNSSLSKPSAAYRETLFEMENNGHTIELSPASSDGGVNTVIIDNDTYTLRQFHFHAPSEHTLDGKPFAMELHFVHGNAGGALAVIGVMITEGAENAALREAFAALPREPSREGEAKPEVKVNLADLLAVGQSMYRYDGSLTTPPCSEGVKWTVATRAVEMSGVQIAVFKALYNGNNRPIQNRYGRPIYFIE